MVTLLAGWGWGWGWGAELEPRLPSVAGLTWEQLTAPGFTVAALVERGLAEAQRDAGTAQLRDAGEEATDSLRVMAAVRVAGRIRELRAAALTAYWDKAAGARSVSERWLAALDFEPQTEALAWLMEAEALVTTRCGSLDFLRAYPLHGGLKPDPFLSAAAMDRAREGLPALEALADDQVRRRLEAALDREDRAGGAQGRQWAERTAAVFAKAEVAPTFRWVRWVHGELERRRLVAPEPAVPAAWSAAVRQARQKALDAGIAAEGERRTQAEARADYLLHLAGSSAADLGPAALDHALAQALDLRVSADALALQRNPRALDHAQARKLARDAVAKSRPVQAFLERVRADYADARRTELFAPDDLKLRAIREVAQGLGSERNPLVADYAARLIEIQVVGLEGAALRQREVRVAKFSLPDLGDLRRFAGRRGWPLREWIRAVLMTRLREEGWPDASFTHAVLGGALEQQAQSLATAVQSVLASGPK